MRFSPMYVSVPKPNKEMILDLSRLDGGLNTWELDYRIASNQSPEMQNMYWVDGALQSRRGQDYIDLTSHGTIYAAYERKFNGMYVFHADTKIYTMDPATGLVTERYTSVTAQQGTFFVFGTKLYYLNGAEYLQMTNLFAVTPVVPYIPVVAINRKPNGTGGSLYQPENRLAPGKTVWFDGDGSATVYYLPYQSIDATTVTCTVSGVAKVEGTDFTVNRTLGTLTFTTAPASGENNVKITCYKADAATQNSILQCRRAIVYGANTDLAVVVGGPPAQPNAYFWSGTNTAKDPTYFPFDYYNLAGNADEYVTGFGKQQKMLVIFKERSIGKAEFGTTTIDTRDYLTLDYIPVNDRIGCDLPNTIQLVQNNLVFGNTIAGVHMLLDTSSSGENNVASLSRNINGTTVRPGLISDIRAVAATGVTSVDDGQRYWVCADGNAYVWDYTLSPYTGKEERLSWFPFTNITPVAWINTGTDVVYMSTSGRAVMFIDDYADYGDGIPRVFRFATQFFDTYEVLKNITKVIFVVRSDTNTAIDIRYETDYENRDDLTPIRAYNYRLVPRNLLRRGLATVRYALAAIRQPWCQHVRHFSMRLTNSIAFTDMSIVSAQVFYRYSGGDR